MESFFIKPSLDQWLAQAKAEPDSGKAGMFLFHNGVVRSTPRREAREGVTGLPSVRAIRFHYDGEKVLKAETDTRAMPGVCYVRTWLNDGTLSVGEDLMLVLVGGDTRPHVIAALEYLVGRLKSECVSEEELF